MTRFLRELPKFGGATHMPNGSWCEVCQPRIVIVTCPDCGAGQTTEPSDCGSVDFVCLNPKCKHASSFLLKGW